MTRSIGGSTYYMNKGLKHVGIYLDPKVHQGLKDKAKRELRTLHMTITHILTEALKNERT